MKKALLLIILLFSLINLKAQPRFYISNQARILNQNGDSLRFPFTGGFNSPQFSAVDLNYDGVKDLFIFDRSGDKVMTFLSLGNGSYIYAPEYEHLFPRMMNWALLVDYNNDGKEDIFTHHIHLYTQSWMSLYRNKSSGPVPSFEATHDILMQVRDTTLSWNNDSNRFDTIVHNPQQVNNFRFNIPAITDIDGDGDIDVLANDPNSATAEFYKNYSKEWGFPNDSLRFREIDQEWGYYRDAANVFQLYDSASASMKLHETDSIVLNTYTMAKLYKKHTSGTTLLLLDVDSDGDKELLQGNISCKRLWFMKNGRKEFSQRYDTLVTADSIWPLGTKRAAIHDFAAAYHLDADQDGLKDIIVASNRRVDGQLTHNVMLYRNTGNAQTASFTFVKDDYLVEHTLDHGKNSVPCFFDFDGDGDEDLLVAASGDSGVTGVLGDRIYLYEKLANRVFKLKDMDYLGLSSLRLKEIYPAIGDLNGDGKKDMILGTAPGVIYHFQNNSNGSVASFVNKGKLFPILIPGYMAAPQIIDVDKDQLPDLLIGIHNGTVQYYRNTGTASDPVFTLVTNQFGNITSQEFTEALNPPRYEDEGRAAPHLCDLEGDGSYDLFVGSFRGFVKLYRNISSNLSGTFQQDSLWFNYLGTGSYGAYSFGNYSTVASSRIDDDTIPDLMIGNSRGGLTLLGSKATIGGKLGVGSQKPGALFKVYPNPASGVLFINILKTAQVKEVELIDILGRTQFQVIINDGQESLQINTSQLPAGVYFIRGSGPGVTHVEKVIVR